MLTRIEKNKIKLLISALSLMVLFPIDSKYIIRVIFYLHSLLAYNRRMFAVTPHTSHSCQATTYNHTPTFFQPTPLAQAPCSLGHHFINQIVDSPPSYEETWAGLTKFFHDKNELSLDIFVHSTYDHAELAMRQSILDQIDLDAEALGIQLNTEWKDYFKDIAKLVIHGALADTDHGVCDDSASLGVVTALKDQLDNGYRETVGIVVLHPPEGHAFAVANFKNITDFHDQHANDQSKAVRSIDDYSKILKAVAPANPKRAVTCCDAWLDHHVSTDDFANAYIRKNRLKKPSDATRASQPQIKIAAYDYSIPSFRKNRNEDNSIFRRFVKDSLRSLLGIFEGINNVHQISPSHIQTQRHRRRS